MPDGSLYKGTFKAGLRNGDGEFSSPDGFRYVGQWVAGDVRWRGKGDRDLSRRRPSMNGISRPASARAEGTLTYASGEVATGMVAERHPDAPHRRGKAPFKRPAFLKLIGLRVKSGLHPAR
jgi:hypothetical protein